MHSCGLMSYDPVPPVFDGIHPFIGFLDHSNPYILLFELFDMDRIEVKHHIITTHHTDIIDNFISEQELVVATS